MTAQTLEHAAQLVWAWALTLFMAVGALAWLLARWSGRRDEQFARRYALQGLLVAGALGPAWLGAVPFALALSLAAWFCEREVEQVLATRHRVLPATRRVTGLALAAALTWLGLHPPDVHALWLPCAGCLALAWPWLFWGAPTRVRERMARGTAWAWPAVALLALGSLTARPTLFLDMAFLYAALELNDSAAFIVGRAFGRRPMAPTLSPNKTWEGAAAGLLAAAGVGLLLAFCQPGRALLACALLGALLGCLGTLADLSASALKRALGVKDYGTALGPHGGLLDAYDSLILVGPFWCALLAWLEP